MDAERPWRYLQVDLACWVLIGLLVTAWDAVVYDLPVGSGLKVVLGCFTLGIFGATSLALDVEREMIDSLARSDHPAPPPGGRFLSITTKFMVFVGLCLGVICVIQRLSAGEPFEFAWVAREVLFVFAVLFLGTVVVLHKYSRNLHLMFDLQLGALRRVGDGDYESYVPVVSHDEFIGDAAMAVFGLGSGGDARAEALAAGMARRCLAVLNERLEGRGLPPVDNGVGIHYGSAVAGNVGSPDRKEDTVIGDAVNTAARLDKLTRTVGVPLIVSEEVYHGLSASDREGLQPLGAHALKGKTTPVTVYGTSAC